MPQRLEGSKKDFYNNVLILSFRVFKLRVLESWSLEVFEVIKTFWTNTPTQLFLLLAIVYYYK